MRPDIKNAIQDFALAIIKAFTRKINSNSDYDATQKNSRSLIRLIVIAIIIFGVVFLIIALIALWGVNPDFVYFLRWLFTILYELGKDSF